MNNSNFSSEEKHTQYIELNSNEKRSTHLISGYDVEIHLNSLKTVVNEAHFTNNQVSSQIIDDHDWEQKYHLGNIVAVTGDYVAYAVKAQTGDDFVCVFHKQFGFRFIISPPFSGCITDLAFSFCDDILLACIDEANRLRIYRIEKTDTMLKTEKKTNLFNIFLILFHWHTLILGVDLLSSTKSPNKLSWCCFIPDNNDIDENDPINDAHTLLAVTNGSKVELLNVAIAAQSYIGETILTLNQIENGYLMYEDNQGLVTCVCFSPDGAAIGTGTDTGEIKFFSINFDQPNSCGCLHCWVPHDGRPISCLYFLDDHKNLTQDTQLWRYAISGCDFNSELKIWSCKNWCCLQIIRFQYSFMEISPLVHSQTKLLLKSSIDLTSHFLVLSDINRKCLYVLTIFQDSEQNRAEFTSINEFLLKAPALSFVITAADRLNRKNVSEQSQQQNENSMATYAVKLYSIHTKFFQELLVIFETKNFIHTNTTILSPIVHNHHTSNTFSNHSPLKYSDDIIDDFRFDSYNSQLITRDRSSFPPPPSSDRLCLVGDLMTMPNYSIDDLLSPNSSLTNVTRDTTRSFLAADGLSNGANNHISTTPTVDPIHGLLLGSTTAFDPIHRSVHHQTPLTSPPQQQTTAIHPQSLINEMFSHGLIQTTATTADTTNKTRKLNNRGSTSPFDLDDKEVAESMAGTTNYQHQFDVLVNDTDDVDNVFIPIKTNDDELDQLDENGQVNESRTQDPLLSPQKYGEASLWSKSCHSRNDSPMKGMTASSRQAMGDFSATETSDKDDDSTADEGEQQPQTHPRIKRRARSPNSILPLQSGSIGNEALHAIRELSSQLSSFRVNYLIQPPPLTSSSTATTAITNPQDFSEKLERCSQRIEQLTNKFDRFMTLDQQQTPGANIHSILSTRPNPSDNVTSNNGSLNSDLNLTDAHYARLENILVEKIQVYVQGAVKAVFEPYKDLKDNLHKDLAHKLLSTDNVIKSTMTQIFRSKTMIDSLSNAVAGTVQSTMISTYRDAFNQIVIPSFEKAALNMFQQCNEAFKKGTKEYLQEMAENGRQQQRLSQQQREQVLSEVKKETVILLKDFERKCQEVCLTVKNDFNQYMRTNLTSVICDTSQTVLKNETSLLLHELFTNQKNDINNLLLQHFQRFQQQQQSQQSPQQTVPSKTRTTTSRTTTPLPVLNDNSQQQQHETKQQYVLNLVRHGQINQAFESVLSAGDLNLVIFLCENLRPSQLFSIQPLPLQTPVLLSLIHQLAADLIHHQEVKYNYLQEALICLDLSHPSVRSVLIDLNGKLYTYIQANSTAIMAKKFQLLLMASQGLVQRIAQQRATPSLSQQTKSSLSTT